MVDSSPPSLGSPITTPPPMWLHPPPFRVAAPLTGQQLGNGIVNGNGSTYGVLSSWSVTLGGSTSGSCSRICGCSLARSAAAEETENRKWEMNNFGLHFPRLLVGWLASSGQCLQNSRRWDFAAVQQQRTLLKSFNYREWQEVSAGAALINQRCRLSLAVAAGSQALDTVLGALPKNRLQ